MEQVLHLLLGQSRVASIEVQTDPGRLRPSDIPVLRGSAEKIQQATGWRPRIAFEQTLVDLLEYWRRRIPAPSR
jgi:GDP-4-dehydro-6-deoxy-D-mannose reductase